MNCAWYNEGVKFESYGGKCMNGLYVSDLDGTLLRISRDVKDFWHAKTLMSKLFDSENITFWLVWVY